MLDHAMLDRAEENSFAKTLCGQNDGPISRIPNQWRKFSAKSAMTQAILKIDQLDLECVMKKVQNEEGWGILRLQQAQLHYKQFLKLMVLEPSTSLVPTHDIDQVWHTAILFTKKYHADCQNIFGKYIHHNPSEGDGSELAEAANETARLFLIHFMEDIRVNGNCRHVCTDTQTSCTKCNGKPCSK